MRKRKQPPKSVAEQLEDVAKHDREILERLRREFEAGDDMALNEAYLWRDGRAERWVLDGLARRLNKELDESPRGKNINRELLRWSMYTWVQNKRVQNKRIFSQEDALSLAGMICDCEAPTVWESYKSFKRKNHFPPGILEVDEPSPLDGLGAIDGFSDGLIRKRIAAWYRREGKTEKEAEKRANNLLTPSFSDR